MHQLLVLFNCLASKFLKYSLLFFSFLCQETETLIIIMIMGEQHTAAMITSNYSVANEVAI